VLKINTTDYTFSRINVGQNPVEISADSTGVYVTCLDDTLWKIATTGVVTSISTGADPVGIACKNGLIFVACSYGNEVRVYNQSMQLVKTVSTSNEPQYLSFTDTELVVACHGDSVVERYLLSDYTPTVSTVLPQWVFGLAYYGGNVIAFSGNPGIPPRSYVRDSIPYKFGFDPQYKVLRNTLITSEQQTVDGFDPSISLPASIPIAANATLYKNGVSVGQTTTVMPGDKLSISMMSESGYNQKTVVRLSVGAYSTDFVSLTLMYDDVVNPVWFNPTQVSDIGLSTFSDEVVIDGLTDGFTSTCSLDSGVLFKNGVPVSGNSTTVTNGDKIKIQQTSVDGAVYSTLLLGGHPSTWLLFYTSDVPTYLRSTPTIPDYTDADSNTHYESDKSTPLNIQYITDNRGGLVGYIYVDLEPFPGVELKVNGQIPTYDEVTGRTKVKFNDRITLDGTSTDVPYGKTFSYAVLDGKLVSFAIYTKADITPDPILIPDIYEALPRATYPCRAFHVEGVSGYGAKIPISVDFGTLYANGIPMGTNGTVQLHDVVTWSVVEEGPYGGDVVYNMVYGDTPVTWTLHNKELAGATLNHNNTFAINDNVYQFMHPQGVSKTESDRPTSVVGTQPELRIVTAPVKSGNKYSSFGRFAQTPDAVEVMNHSTSTWNKADYFVPGKVAAREFVREFAHPGAAVVVNKFEREWHESFAQHAQTVDNTPEAIQYATTHTEFECVAIRMTGADARLSDTEFVQMKPAHVLGNTEFQKQVNQTRVVDTGFIREDGFRSNHMVQMEVVQFGTFNHSFIPAEATMATRHSSSVEFTKPAVVYNRPALEVDRYFDTSSKPELREFERDWGSKIGGSVSYAEKTFSVVEFANVSKFTIAGVAGSDKFQKTTDYPAYDGKASTVELAAKLAEIDGFEGAQVFLDFDDRYIYKGVCALRNSKNISGWVKGG
jgi:hypothetical protein